MTLQSTFSAHHQTQTDTQFQEISHAGKGTQPTNICLKVLLRALRGKSLSGGQYFLTPCYMEIPIPHVHSQKITSILSSLYKFRLKAAKVGPYPSFSTNVLEDRLTLAMEKERQKTAGYILSHQKQRCSQR